MNRYLSLIRFYNQIGTLLLFIPCTWGLIYARDFSPAHWILFLMGAFIMRSAGCIINDMVDAKLDCHVVRTKNRPLANGSISKASAMIFLSLLLLPSLCVLLQFNELTIKIGIASVFFVILYPFCKRFTHYPQIILGITFNVGIIMAYTAATNSIIWQIFILYAIGILWTIFYDTIYAIQDVKCDISTGIKSIATRFMKIDEHGNLKYQKLYIFLICTVAAMSALLCCLWQASAVFHPVYTNAACIVILSTIPLLLRIVSFKSYIAFLILMSLILFVIDYYFQINFLLFPHITQASCILSLMVTLFVINKINPKSLFQINALIGILISLSIV